MQAGDDIRRSRRQSAVVAQAARADIGLIGLLPTFRAVEQRCQAGGLDGLPA